MHRIRILFVALGLIAPVAVVAPKVEAHGLFRAYQVCSSDHGTVGQFGPWRSSGVSQTASCGWTITYRAVLGDWAYDVARIDGRYYTVAVG